jgi:hypothetical protein
MPREPRAHDFIEYNVRIIAKHCEIFRLTVGQSQYINVSRIFYCFDRLSHDA